MATALEAARIGSYVALALEKQDILAVLWAVLTMLVVILLYDQLLFRPLVAWSAKFRFETTAGATASDPWMLRLMRRTRLLKFFGEMVGDALAFVGGLRLSFTGRARTLSVPKVPKRWMWRGSQCCWCWWDWRFGEWSGSRLRR